MRISLIIILLSLVIVLKAQKTSEFSTIDKIAVQIPDSLNSSTSGIAGFINSNFQNPKDKARAIFIWITNNIQYDIENMFAINFYQSSAEIVDQVISTGKGICMHFAELFNDIANKVGIKTYVISGFTKQNGFVDFIPQSWCAGFIDTAWYFFDPTWGSGYIQNAKFIRQTNNFYFLTKPEQLIKSHMPFDPLWQFLNYPITNQEFYEGKIQLNKSKLFFNFIDTLNAYEHESEIERLVSSSRRIESNGVRNSLIFDRLQHNKREIEYYNNKMQVESFNTAVNTFNEGILQINRFVEYRNNQFTPKKTDDQIRQMIVIVELSFNKSRDILKGIINPDPNIAASMIQLNKSIDEVEVNLKEQKTFLQKYFQTPKVLRKSLFYKQTWMGIPINR